MTFHKDIVPWIPARLLPIALLLILAGPASAQVTVSGLVTKTVYADQVTFTVTPQAGYVVTPKVDGVAVATGTPVKLTAVDYHELAIHWRQTASGTQGDQVIQFIVRSSERKDSEWGLPPWVPYPMIPSAAAEFAGAHLDVVIPKAWPVGLEIPVVAWVRDGTGKRVGANGLVQAPEHPGRPLQLLRGVGAAHLAAQVAAGPLGYTARIKTLETAKTVDVEASPVWTYVTGALGATADWGENARISVTGTVTVPAGMTLTIGAGTIVRMGAKTDLTVNGKLVVNGTADRPVAFVPASAAAPWGGFIIKGSTAIVEMHYAMATGGCWDTNWFTNNPGSGGTHLPNQCLLYVSGGAKVTLDDTYLFDCNGQAGHGESSYLTLNRCLYDRFLTGGEYNGCVMTMNRCAVIEFPNESMPFADDDGDAIYFTGGGSIGTSYTLTECLIGWAHDDGIDSGSGSGGPVTVQGCWIESDYHEGFAWSGGSSATPRRPTVTDSVVINCGQGFESGWDYPMAVADRLLSIGNCIGARFGDNYNWSYLGRLDVTNSIILHNYRDIWGRTWDNWLEHLSQMDLHANYLTAADALHPDNFVWDPLANAALLEPFLPTPATEVGIGIAVRKDELSFDQIALGVPVRLSIFTPRTVSVPYAIEGDAGPLGSGVLEFTAGETVKKIPLDGIDLSARSLVRVTIQSPVNGEITGKDQVEAIRLVQTILIPAGSTWKYLNTGVDQLTAWKERGFVDASWKEGNASLGDNGSVQTTTINIGPTDSRFWTVYFRRTFEVQDPAAFRSLLVRVLRDDGAVVWINGKDAFRSNMALTGAILYATPALSAMSNGSGETTFFEKEIDPAIFLVAGTNTIAVEVHQYNQTSSDLIFDLELKGIQSPVVPTAARFIRGDANGDRDIDISDVLGILFFQFAGTATDCQDALDVDDLGDVNITDAILLLKYLFLDGAPPQPPFPAVGEDPSADGLDCQRR